MRTVTRRTATLLLLAAAAWLGGCRMDANETFIQGSWYFSDPHLQQVISESQLEVFWSFDRGTFEQYACCFAKQQMWGRYQILQSEGDTMILELFNINGDLNSEPIDVRVTLDRQQNTIKIQRQGPFTRNTGGN
jgi:hypothetical protein